MYEDIKTALSMCISDVSSCDGCPYIDVNECSWTLRQDALNAIKSLDNGLQYLSALNTKLAEELQESLNLKDGVGGG